MAVTLSAVNIALLIIASLYIQDWKNSMDDVGTRGAQEGKGEERGSGAWVASGVFVFTFVHGLHY